MNVLEFLMITSDYIENKEGVVITFADGKMAKQKTSFYMALHGLLTDGLKENKLIAKVLNDQIDDVLAFIPVDAYAEREFINALTEVIVANVNQRATEAFEFFNANYKGDRKAFAIEFINHSMFRFVTVLFTNNTYEAMKDRIIKDVLGETRRLERARTYLKGCGFERELKIIEEDG
jgi:hypothetical protein